MYMFNPQVYKNECWLLLFVNSLSISLLSTLIISDKALAHCQQITKMHALVIGGSGRTGKLVIDELLKRGTVNSLNS